MILAAVRKIKCVGDQLGCLYIFFVINKAEPFRQRHMVFVENSDVQYAGRKIAGLNCSGKTACSLFQGLFENYMMLHLPDHVCGLEYRIILMLENFKLNFFWRIQ